MNAAAKVRLLHELLSDEDRDDGAPVMNCPVPAMLSAQAEGALDGEAGRQIREHLTSCDACAELYERLVAFARPETILDPPVKSSEAAAWQAAQPRLRRALHQAIAPAEPLKPRRRFSFFTLAPRTQWALGACAACLAAGVTLIAFEEMRPSTAGAPGQQALVVAPPEPASGAFPSEPAAPQPQSTEPAASSSAAPPADTAMPDTSLGASPSSTAEADDGVAPPPPVRVSSASAAVARMPASVQGQISSAPTASFTLAAGTSVQLEITSAVPGQDSSWVVQGRLISSSGSDSTAPFDSAAFSGVMRAGASEVQVTISTVSAGGHSNAVQPAQLVGVTLEQALADSEMHGGAVLQGQISGDTTLHTAAN